MSLLTDLRAVSENAVEQVASRFSDLPRPLLAAIGAGDMAVERLADLREALMDSIGDRVGSRSVDTADVRAAVGDLPSRVQKVAADVAGNIEQFAAEAPGKAQDLIAQLPDKLSELQLAAQTLSPDAIKDTVEAYTQLVGLIFGNLADRGDKTWSKVRSAGLRPGAVVDAATGTKSSPAEKATPRSAASGARAEAKPTATRVSPPGPRAPHTAAKTPPKPHGAKSETPRSARSATPKDGQPKVATHASAPKSTAKPATPASSARPATPKSSAKPATPHSSAAPATPGPETGESID